MRVTVWLFVFLSAAVAITPAHSKNAPAFWITWSANSYTAPHFTGKALPVNGSVVTVVFELIENGQVVNLASQNVRWFLGTVLIQQGRGMKEFTFKAGGSGGARLVRVDLPNFRDGATLVKSVQIPVVEPQVIINAPYVKNAVAPNELVLQALPYYFNVRRASELLFSWNVNNEAPEGTTSRPENLTVTLPMGIPAKSKVFIEVEVENINNRKEATRAQALFTTR